jgi:hypothetical protein
MEKMMGAFKNVDWKQLGEDLKTFGQRFAAGDFAKISPKPHELPAVGGMASRMASFMVWRRALLILATILSIVLAIKSCFDPHTLESSYVEAETKTWKKANPHPSEAQIKQFEQTIIVQRQNITAGFGESNVSIFNTLIVGLWGSVFVSIVFIILAARDWRNWRKSRKWALLAVAVVLGPQLIAMLIPWGSMMNFKHLAAQGMGAEQIKSTKIGIQVLVLFVVLYTSLPFFYGLVNGVLRSSLSTKTLVPASIVCGWSSLLLAVTIAVPWFIAFSIVDQLELDALIVLGVLCLLAAPLSIVFKARRLGLPLTAEEATPLVKRTKLVLTSLNVVGMAMILAYLHDKEMVTPGDILTLVIHYFANLMLVQVVAVDMLVLLLDRAHRKLASDVSPDESLRQLGEVLAVK